MYDVFMGEQPIRTAEEQAEIDAHLAELEAVDAAREARTAKRAKCSRRRGTGYVRQYHYNEAGRCFACN